MSKQRKGGSKKPTMIIKYKIQKKHQGRRVGDKRGHRKFLELFMKRFSSFLGKKQCKSKSQIAFVLFIW